MSNDCAMEHREADKTINNNYLEFFWVANKSFFG